MALDAGVLIPLPGETGPSNRGRLHHVEVAGTKSIGGKTVYGFVTHMALLYDGTVYECRPKGGCVKRPLTEFMQGRESTVIYLFREA